MAESKEARNKALVLKAFDTLFNKRDYSGRRTTFNTVPTSQLLDVNHKEKRTAP